MEILIILLPIIMAMIEQCREDRDRDDIEAGLLKPGIRERIMVRRAIVERYGLSGKALRRKTRKAMKELRNADPEEVTFVMDAVEANIEARG